MIRRQPERPALLTDVAVLERTAGDLAERFVAVFSAATVYRYVFESCTALHATATITTHSSP